MVEQHQLLIIRQPAIESSLRCSICLTNGLMVSAEDAATILSMPRREVYRAVETGSVHFIETLEGILFVCIESLLSASSASSVQFQEKHLRELKEKVETNF